MTLRPEHWRAVSKARVVLWAETHRFWDQIAWIPVPASPLLVGPRATHSTDLGLVYPSVQWPQWGHLLGARTGCLLGFISPLDNAMSDHHPEVLEGWAQGHPIHCLHRPCAAGMDGLCFLHDGPTLFQAWGHTQPTEAGELQCILD